MLYTTHLQNVDNYFDTYCMSNNFNTYFVSSFNGASSRHFRNSCLTEIEFEHVCSEWECCPYMVIYFFSRYIQLFPFENKRIYSIKVKKIELPLSNFKKIQNVGTKAKYTFSTTLKAEHFWTCAKEKVTCHKNLNYGIVFIKPKINVNMSNHSLCVAFNFLSSLLSSQKRTQKFEQMICTQNTGGQFFHI